MATKQPMSNATAALAYRPVSMLTSLAAGSVATALFKQIWRRVAHEENAPDALQSEYPLRTVLLAAVIEGVIFAVIKALIDRGGAKGFEKLTGAWPGE
jgi:hypothetical protein